MRRRAAVGLTLALAASGPLARDAVAAGRAAAPGPSGAPDLAGARVVHEEAARTEAAIGRARAEADALRRRLESARAAEAGVLAEIARLDQRRSLAAAEARAADLEAGAAERGAARARERAEALARRAEAARVLIGRVADALYRSGEGEALRRVLAAAEAGAPAGEDVLVAVGRHRRLAAELLEATEAAERAAAAAHHAALQAGAARFRASERLEAFEGARRVRQARLDELRRDAAAMQDALAEQAGAQGELQDSLAGRRDWAPTAPARPRAELRLPRLPGLGPPRRSLPFPVPPGSGTVVGRYGEVIDPLRGTRTPRNGIVVHAPEGTPFHAVAAGTVVFADWYKGFGLCVVTDHGEGDLSVVAHASRLAVGVGDRVAAGDALGEVGDTGSLAGSQLYFQLNRDGRPVDPLAWLRGP